LFFASGELHIHGSDDPVVPADHARWMLDAARQVGAPVNILLVPGAIHSNTEIMGAALSTTWQAMTDFFARHLHSWQSQNRTVLTDLTA